MRAQMRQYWANMAGTNLGPRQGEEDYMSPRVFSRASEYLRLASAGDGPFFLVVDSFYPHEPWDAPEEYVRMYDDGPYDRKEPFSVTYGPSEYLAERELRRMKSRYAGR